jgi:hypothetical protein
MADGLRPSNLLSPVAMSVQNVQHALVRSALASFGAACLVAGFAGCGSFGGASDGSLDDAAAGPVDAPLDAATARTDAGENEGGANEVDASIVGCADGTREYLLDTTLHVGVAGCGGAFLAHGMLTKSDAGSPCHKRGGNSAANGLATGLGCSADDLCAVGWHVCASATEFVDSVGTCAEDSGAPESGVFYASATRGTGNLQCDGDGGTNDLFGCGATGVGVGGGCGAFNASLSTFKPISYWLLGGASTELIDVQKQAGPGGVLCCHD